MLCRVCRRIIPDNSCYCLYCGSETTLWDTIYDNDEEINYLPDIPIFDDESDDALASAFGGKNISFPEFTAMYIRESFEILICREMNDSELDYEAFILYIAYCIKSLSDTEFVTNEMCNKIVRYILSNDNSSVATINILIQHTDLFNIFFSALEKCTDGDYGEYRQGYLWPIIEHLITFRYISTPEICAFKENIDYFRETYEFDVDVDSLLEIQQEEEAKRYEEYVRDHPEVLYDGVDYDAIAENYYNDGGGSFNLDDMESDYYEDDAPDYDNY